MERKIAFDIDGVLTENVYIPRAERTCERYHQLKPNNVVIDQIDTLYNQGYRIYIISSRKCKTPKTCFMKWWSDNRSIRPFWRGDVYLGVSKKRKAHLASELGCTMLFDDDTKAIEGCNDTSVQGVLVNNGRYSINKVANFDFQNEHQTTVLIHDIKYKVEEYYKDEPTFGGILRSKPFEPVPWAIPSQVGKKIQFFKYKKFKP